MEFDVECIKDLSDENLKKLLAAMVTGVKDAKKKVSAHINRDKQLMGVWVTKLSLDPPKTLPEELAGIRGQREREFEIALMDNPEAFIAYQVKKMLVQLTDVLRQERTRRIPEKK